MTVVVEGFIGVTIIITIAAIMAAHHAEERLKQRFNMNGNKYHRADMKMFRLKERLRRREPPSRHKCPRAHPLD